MIEQFELRWGSPFDVLCGAVLVALLVFGLTLWGNFRRRRVLGIFGVDLDRASQWVRACARRRWLRSVCATLALICAGFAALQPRGNPTVGEFEVRARDIAVVVDVSRSMLAEDLRPNRLERVKDELARLSANLRGDRIGLIAFAGSAERLCPLTSNYSYFRSVLGNLDTNSAERGGTEIGDALRRAVALLGYRNIFDDVDDDGLGETVVEEEQEETSTSFSDILLITDGENHGLDPSYAVGAAAQHGIGLYVVGIGSPEGSPIPIRGDDGQKDYVRHQGQIVRTRLDEEGLMNLVAQAPRGHYLPVGTDNPDLVDFYERRIAPEGGRSLVEKHVTWTEFFQPFLLAGIFFYLLFLAIPERPRRVRSVRLEELTEARPEPQPTA